MTIPTPSIPVRTEPLEEPRPIRVPAPVPAPEKDPVPVP